jgi:hypothetical protein
MFDQYREGHLTLDQLTKQVMRMVRNWRELLALEINGRMKEDINKILE